MGAAATAQPNDQEAVAQSASIRFPRVHVAIEKRLLSEPLLLGLRLVRVEQLARIHRAKHDVTDIHAIG